MQNSEIHFGRWVVAEDGIKTMRENNAPIEFGIDDLWEYETDNNTNYFFYPIDICDYEWLSNTDILDFNSAFLVALEKFSDSKPKTFPILSWTLTLTKQYDRINRSLDINSFEGKTKWDSMRKYFEKESTETLLELHRYGGSKEIRYDGIEHKEILGDKNSRMP